ncbi:MAG: NADH-quinone oxidoreductase subunit C [Bacteroidetes bacterium]|nr:MAG: NADH-quinone oxidoreductase subunit C [Bacteroidota bacterium]
MESESKKSVGNPTPATLAFHFSPIGTPEDQPESVNPHVKSTGECAGVVEALRAEFGEAIEEISEYAGEKTVRITRTKIRAACQFLKDQQGFTYFADLGGIDRFTEENRYEVFYNLVSMSEKKRIRLVTRIDEDDLTVDSVCEVFRAANWNERECFDMFGIRFNDHPDLRRMFMPEDFEYYPLRKEFPLLGVPGSLPLPPQSPEAGLTLDPFPAAHGSKPATSFEEEERTELL